MPTYKGNLGDMGVYYGSTKGQVVSLEKTMGANEYPTKLVFGAYSSSNAGYWRCSKVGYYETIKMAICDTSGGNAKEIMNYLMPPQTSNTTGYRSFSFENKNLKGKTVALKFTNTSDAAWWHGMSSYTLTTAIDSYNITVNSRALYH